MLKGAAATEPPDKEIIPQLAPDGAIDTVPTPYNDRKSSITHRPCRGFGRDKRPRLSANVGAYSISGRASERGASRRAVRGRPGRMVPTGWWIEYPPPSKKEIASAAAIF